MVPKNSFQQRRRQTDTAEEVPTARRDAVRPYNIMDLGERETPSSASDLRESIGTLKISMS